MTINEDFEHATKAAMKNGHAVNHYFSVTPLGDLRRQCRECGRSLFQFSDNSVDGSLITASRCHSYQAANGCLKGFPLPAGWAGIK